ncbi:MAG: hypothetical protein K1X55_01995 [Chitinophagales bacterium]|nr:hypothetical protein [Chitinophagales bacterium]
MDTFFVSCEDLKEFFNIKKKGNLVVSVVNLPQYLGMVLHIGIQFDDDTKKYLLCLEWISYGLDFYGDTIQEGYIYEMKDVDHLLTYLWRHYHISVNEIPKAFKFDAEKHPKYYENEEERHLFSAAWEKFSRDFANGYFLDKNLKLVYSSH